MQLTTGAMTAALAGLGIAVAIGAAPLAAADPSNNPAPPNCQALQRHANSGQDAGIDCNGAGGTSAGVATTAGPTAAPGADPSVPFGTQ